MKEEHKREPLETSQIVKVLFLFLPIRNKKKIKKEVKQSKTDRKESNTGVKQIGNSGTHPSKAENYWCAINTQCIIVVHRTHIFTHNAFLHLPLNRFLTFHK